MSKYFMLVLGFCLLGCTPNAGKAIRTLESAGFTDVQLGGYPLFGGCSEDDTFNINFEAKGPTGIPVEGTLCCGLIKSCTIRLD